VLQSYLFGFKWDGGFRLRGDGEMMAFKKKKETRKENQRWFSMTSSTHNHSTDWLAPRVEAALG